MWRCSCVGVQLPSHVQLFMTPWAAACQASLSLTISQSLPKFMPIESVVPPKHLILCHPLLLLPSIFSNIRVFFSESAVHVSSPCAFWRVMFEFLVEFGLRLAVTVAHPPVANLWVRESIDAHLPLLRQRVPYLPNKLLSSALPNWL